MFRGEFVIWLAEQDFINIPLTLLDGTLQGTVIHQIVFAFQRPDTDQKELLALLESLIDQGADPDLGVGKHGTPLHVAAEKGLHDVAKLLISKSQNAQTLVNKIRPQ